MHTPNPDEPRPDPQHDEDDDRQPPVPPDQEDDVIPIQEPPRPGKDGPPLIAIQRRGSRVPACCATMIWRRHSVCL